MVLKHFQVLKNRTIWRGGARAIGALQRSYFPKFALGGAQARPRFRHLFGGLRGGSKTFRMDLL